MTTSPIGFHTPEKQIVRRPHGISRHYETEERGAVFQGELLPTHASSTLGTEPERDGFRVAYYTTPSGKEHAIVQQRPSGTPCGYGCMMMLFLDRVLSAPDPKAEYRLHSEDKQSIIERFYTSDTLTDAFQLRQEAQNYRTGVTLKVIAFAKKTFQPENKTIDERVEVATGAGIIRSLKAKLKSGSVVQAITHPELHGHWVIIDEYAKGYFYIRDPFSGKAYKVSEKELTPMLLKGIECEYGLRVEK